MKKILIVALIFLSSCSSTNLLEKRYDNKFVFKVYDGILYEFYYTNAIVYHDGYIEFTDHDGGVRRVSEYSIEQLVQIQK